MIGRKIDAVECIGMDTKVETGLNRIGHEYRVPLPSNGRCRPTLVSRAMIARLMAIWTINQSGDSDGAVEPVTDVPGCCFE